MPRDCFYLIQGDPGSGKTTLALQFLLEGVRQGEAVFYVTLSETRDELLKVTRSHGWSVENIPLLELSAIDQLLRPEAQTTVFHPSEVELNKVSKLLSAFQSSKDMQKKSNQTKKRIRVMLVDDHAHMRLALRTFINAERDLTVVAEADRGDAAL